MTKLCVFGWLTLVIFQLFSPWKLTIQRRSVSDSSSLTTDIAALMPVEDDSQANPQGQGRKKDHIERDFGDLEHAFIKSVGDPSDAPRRSRDDSIKLIYSAKSPDDWLELIRGHDDHGLMPLTKITQRYIFEKQNPYDCEGQRFLILNKFPGDDAFGLGAIVQRISDYLSVAIQTNSVLLYAEDSPPGEHFMQDPADGGDHSCGRSFNCIFQKLSRCGSDAQKGIKTKAQSIFAGSVYDEVDAEVYLAKHGSPIPPIFEAALKLIQPDITAEMLKYWWRAQAAAYIMRLNGPATSRMKELRLGIDTKQMGIQWGVEGQPQEVDLPFPLPEGTFSMHVRHGDKG